MLLVAALPLWIQSRDSSTRRNILGLAREGGDRRPEEPDNKFLRRPLLPIRCDPPDLRPEKPLLYAAFMSAVNASVDPSLPQARLAVTCALTLPWGLV